MCNFSALHTHSIWSIRDSINSIEDIIDKAKEFGYHSFAITDHGNLGAVVRAELASQEAGIPFIKGVEAYVAPRHRTSKETGVDRGYYHLNLYAGDLEAYKALCYLITESNKPENFYYKPRIDRELLAEYGSKYNIICSSGCLASELSRSILKYKRFEYEGEDKAELVNENFKEVIDWYKGIFKDRYYLEIHNHGIPAEGAVAETIIDYGKKIGLKTIFALDSHYMNPEDKFYHNIMLSIRDKKTVDNCSGYDGTNHCFLPYETLKTLSYNEEYLFNTVELAERCSVKLPLGKMAMPKLYPNSTISESEILYNLAYGKLQGKFNKNIPLDYQQRFDYEFRTIADAGFSGYFLVVKDFIDWANTNSIRTGISRGSIGASLVAYLLGIIKMDPLKYENLLFERFLSRSRVAVPDLKFKAVS